VRRPKPRGARWEPGHHNNVTIAPLPWQPLPHDNGYQYFGIHVVKAFIHAQ